MNCVYVCLDSVNKHFGPQLLGHFFLFVIYIYFIYLFIFQTQRYYIWQSESFSFFLVVKFIINQDVFQLNKTIVKLRVKLEGHKFKENERG